MRDNLKQCPFCGDDRVKMDDDGWESIGQPARQWHVVCWGGCGARSGTYNSESEAVTTWNTRASDPMAEAMATHIEDIDRELNIFGFVSPTTLVNAKSTAKSFREATK